MDIEDFISAERLEAYKKLTDRDKKAVALHNHTLQLGTSLMSMIALTELSLRNVTNYQIIRDFGDQDWLLPDHKVLPLKASDQVMISKAQSHARKAIYSKLSYADKSNLDAQAFPNGVPANSTHKSIVKKRQLLFTPSHGQIISQLTLVFWKRLYSNDYEETIWKKSLKKIFPNKEIKRGQVSKSLEVIYSARNRVAHHEPMHGDRLENTMRSIEFIRNSIGARKGDETTNFKSFSNVHFLRLRMDYAAFKEAWETLT